MCIDAVDGAMQRLDAPIGDGVHVDVEGGLVELDHVDAVGGEPADLLVEQIGEGHRHLDAVAVMRVGDGVDDGHRAGQGEFELARVWARASRASRACTRRRSFNAPTTVGHIAS